MVGSPFYSMIFSFNLKTNNPLCCMYIYKKYIPLKDKRLGILVDLLYGFFLAGIYSANYRNWDLYTTNYLFGKASFRDHICLRNVQYKQMPTLGLRLVLGYRGGSA